MLMRVVCSKMFVEDINLNFKRQQNEIECEKKKCLVLYCQKIKMLKLKWRKDKISN